VNGSGPSQAGLVDRAAEILRAGPICDGCLGRAFGRSGRGLANAERGAALRLTLGILGEEGKTGRCWVCDGLFSRLDAWAERAAGAVGDLEFSTYLFGVHPSARLDAMEAHFAERFPTGRHEPLKRAFNREVGKRFERRFAGTTMDPEDPHVSFLIDLARDAISLRIGSVFVYGRYRKLVRGIPQTRWPCRRCRGRGCSTCGGTGKQYPESVEEWVASPFLEATEAAGERFHGAGREDIDARMLEAGRPFVLELRAPRRRTLDLEGLRRAVNRSAAGRVEISRLAYACRKTVELVKETEARKRYFAKVEFAEGLDGEALTGALRFLIGRIAQRTPNRVAHRRADRVRIRRLYEATGRMTDPRHGEIELTTEGGLYVKELVSGDDDRTNPSLTECLGVETRVTELDVVDVASAAFPDASVDIGERFS
jgi:tRNA pseudouridine synthase 10